MISEDFVLKLLEIVRLQKSPIQTPLEIFINNIPNVLAAIFVAITVFYNCYVLKKTIKHTSNIESNKVAIALKQEWLKDITDALSNYFSVGHDLELYLTKLNKVDIKAAEFLELNSRKSQAEIRLTVLLDKDNSVHQDFKKEMTSVEADMVKLLSARIKGKKAVALKTIYSDELKEKISELVADANKVLMEYIEEMTTPC